MSEHLTNVKQAGNHAEDGSGELHVVVGAGATGTATAKLLAERGHDVRVITRSGTGPRLDRIELVPADATDEVAMVRLSTGATAVYNCANPPYNRWTTAWPPLAASLLAAAEANDAVLVTLSNLYGCNSSNGPMKSSDPLDPPSVKGGVRAQMWHDALAAHRAGRVRVTEARASDFIGPDAGAKSHMGDRVVPRVLTGKSVSLLGRVDVAHSWTAIDDVAATLVTIASDERAWGRAWNVPTEPPVSQRELVERICALAEVDPVKVRSIPRFGVSLIGVVMPLMRELKEVLYQFEQPFIIDSEETTNTFGLEPTPLDDTLRATIASYRRALTESGAGSSAVGSSVSSRHNRSRTTL
nr:putative NAD-dependent epimerase/dehydratase family protein [uncultured bacterium]